jgi:ABC-type antimicrobial peptide transport system permease subunit
MTGWTLVSRSLRFYWRSHLGMLLGAILATAILVGALAVGDSVRYSLRELALARLQGIHLALHAPDRFFRTQLADDLKSDLNAPVAPVVLLHGTAAGDEGRVGGIQVLGIDERFWQLSPAGAPPANAEPSIAVNQRLATKLNLKVGTDLLLRVENPSLLSRDAPLSKTDEATVAIRLPVSRIVGDSELGRFGLQASQIPPYNVFLPLKYLQEQIKRPDRINALLIGSGTGAAPTAQAAGEALRKRWQVADAGLEVRTLPTPPITEVRTDRIFLDDPTAKASLEAAPGAHGVLSYFVNELRVGTRATPYSIVAAVESDPIPAGMADDEVVINQWLASDLKAKPGDTVTVRYFISGPQRKLVEQTASFRVRSIVPIIGAAADRNLMPQFPGVADSENCRDWEPGIPIDLKKIRDTDEKYWDAYKGTPKAFITLKAGQKIWESRWGNLTAVRYPATTAPDVVASRIRTTLDPASVGHFFQPVREQALAASSQSMDFGGLFIGFSFFLIVAALLLMALLFAFEVERRAGEVGLLLALGIPAKRVRSFLLLEGGALALVAAIIGGFTGVLYTQAVVRGLSTIWSGAVASSPLQYHAAPATLAGGAVGGFLVALFTIWLVARKQGKAPARELLSSEGGSARQPAVTKVRRWLPGIPTAVICAVGAAAMGAGAATASHEAAAEYFFTGGALLLIAGIAACRALLARMEKGVALRSLTLGSLGARNTVRRAGRSLAVIALLASGSFLVVSIGASRHDPHDGAERRAAGTGGFALYGEATLPVYHDLNSEAGRDEWGLDAEELKDVHILPLRLREGEDASCLNLNRAQVPRVLGVDPERLRELKAFTFTGTAKGVEGKDPWTALQQPQPDGAVPVIGDVNTVTWSLGKGIGNTLPYVDDRGKPIQLRVVGILANSVLQGSLITSEEQFMRQFPGQSGYQVFLIDAPKERVAEVSKSLSRALEDAGLDLTPTPQRMADFNSVENTYLSIFAVLGGLGLLLGSAGLGVVVLRNVLERRGELGLLRAVGFRNGALQWMVFSEHSLLLGLGLLVGVIAALLAVLPALSSPGAEVPYGTLALTLLAVLVSGVLWTWGATVLALRGSLMSALRNE